ncbi:DUF2484 family protein [Paracoccus sp. MBLB3053]|uniref:DUF2484 family protein n=1 Tax=Paracoccus aurantius TaxID=3073814 RepID=A0ABU2HUF7_9RHOB|nr:DUF2484 family protein [Paracoccus sp. MBLB3053]MDS9468682.1 DUF2484 family protein [Paracoccus sp. MBLB3053]
MIGLASHPGLAALGGLGWMLFASALPLLRPVWRTALFWGLVAAGVPILGWLTYLCGPGFGVLFMALGLSILVWPPLEMLRRRRRGSAHPGAQ